MNAVLYYFEIDYIQSAFALFLLFSIRHNSENAKTELSLYYECKEFHLVGNI